MYTTHNILQRINYNLILFFAAHRKLTCARPTSSGVLKQMEQFQQLLNQTTPTNTPNIIQLETLKKI